MSQNRNIALKKIAFGATIGFTGTVIGLLLQFIVRMIIARIGEQADYGGFYLAMVVVGVVVVLASFGLQDGTTRYIAYVQGRNDPNKTGKIIVASLQISITASIFLCVCFFLLAEPLAMKIFHAPYLTLPFQLLSLTVPFLTITNILSSIYRGFSRMEVQAFTQAVQSTLFLLLLILVALSGLSFTSVYYAYLASIVLSCIILSVYALKKMPVLITITQYKLEPKVTKELLIFSLPLMGTSIFSMLTLYTDTIVLGYFKTPEEVGLYNAAYPLALFITVPYTVFLMIFTPVASYLCSQNLIGELNRSFSVTAKWICFVTLPIFLVLFLFPEIVISFIFGPAYISAAPALRILSLGFIINGLFGPNVGAMIAFGQTRFLMWSVLAAAFSNGLLSITLIPSMGFVGAAISSATAMVLANSLISIKLFTAYKSHPLSKNILKPLISSIIIALVFQFTLGRMIVITFWMMPGLLILYYVIYGITVILTRSFDQEDLVMLSEIDQIIGINTGPFKRLLRKFIHI
jgi:O-antigen/teichoic acid export membrane protein